MANRLEVYKCESCGNIAEVGASGPRDMGQVMKTVMPKVGVRAEGSRVSALVKARLIAPRSE